MIGLLPASAFGETIEVPGEANSISQAIAAADANTDPSDIIEVSTGTYTENIEVLSPLTGTKSVTIRGTNGAKVVIRAAVPGDPLIQINAGTSVTLERLILATSGIGVRIDRATASISNVVITGASTAIDCDAVTSGTFRHLTVHQATNGVSCVNSTVTVENSIFSNVSSAPISLGSLGTSTIDFNLFNPPATSGEQGTNVETGDPLFVAPGSEFNDFHLQQGSAAIGTGKDDVDIGAYGGASASSVPFPPTDVSVVCISGGTQCAVKWTANTDYNVSGYRVAFSSPLLPSASTQVGTASEGTSPLSYAADDPAVCSSGACQVSLSGLPEVDPSNAPAAPAGLAVRFRDSGLDLTWNAVPQATSYQVLLGTTSGSLTVVPGQDRIEGTSTSLSNLINGQRYFAAVKAAIEPTLTAEVAALYGVPVDTTTTVSAGSDPQQDRYGTAVLGPTSGEVSETPEAVAGFPPLKDTGGCFIATAAYGSPLAPQVALLRTWRDRYLAPNTPGRALIRLYETVSPPVADMLRESETLRALVRWTLAPVIGGAWVWLQWPLLPPLAVVGFGVVFLLVGVRRAHRKCGP